MSYAALPTLRTPRLTLRPLEEQDTDAVLNGVANHEVIRWLGHIPYPYGRKDAAAFIARVRRGELRAWAIADGVGFAGVAGLDEELGYWLARPAWGKGYGFEAAHAVVEHWFSDPAHGVIESGHYNDNDRSRRILLALGFAPVRERPRIARALSQDVMGTDLRLTRAAWRARMDFALGTKRLQLRPLAARDAPAIMELAVSQVTRMLFSLKTGLGRDAAERFIAERRWRGLPGFALGVVFDGKVIGYVATANNSPVELYYALHPDLWGRGLMTEALAAFLPEVFRRFPLSRVVADRFEDNRASERVLGKLGFEQTGRDVGTSPGRLEPAPVITYALTRDRLRAAT